MPSTSWCGANLAALMPAVRRLAATAGQRIMAIYATDFTVSHKDDRSPLTQADMAAHDTLVHGLAELTPALPVLSEESAAIDFAERARWPCYWLIDPLDGTREFVSRNGEFTVNIALIADHRPVLGVVHVPASGISYSAHHGGGAYKTASAGTPQAIHARRLDGGPVIVVGSRSHRGESLNRFLNRLGEHELISMGSALKSCLVAEGRADIYPRLGPTSEWDTAAAHCVVEESGGHVTDCALRPLRYNTKDSLLNPHFLVFGDASRHWAGYLA